MIWTKVVLLVLGRLLTSSGFAETHTKVYKWLIINEKTNMADF